MRRPWNIINPPVYSLVTEADGKTNMNICTYVTPVSMKPKMYLIGLYHNTKTLENIKNSNIAILQLLSQSQISLIRALGKKSGFKYDKENYLRKRDWLDEWQGFSVLKNTSAYLLLEKTGCKSIGGDHDLYWFEVKKYRTNSEDEVLYFQDLVDAKIIL